MNTPTIVCNMGVFTPSQRNAHILNTTQLMQTIQHSRELENGYEFTFPNNTERIAQLVEFIFNERLCCPFLTFTLTVNSNEAPISLSLTGPIGTQEFLREEFRGAFQ